MTGRLDGRTALVTGASRGIGAATARRFAAEGARVAITARTADAHPTLPGSLAETRRHLDGHGDGHVTIVADLSDPDERARIAAEATAGLGRVDILVNNAAAAMYQPVLEMSAKRQRLMLEMNMVAPIDLAQHLAPAMAARGEGWIVNLSSGSANLRTGPPFPESIQGSSIGMYGASKAALNRITNALAEELHGSGVRVNTIEPRAAVLSEGADAVMAGRLRADQIEPMEAMVEAIVASATCPTDHTGRVDVSLDLIDELGLEVHDLDGRPAG